MTGPPPGGRADELFLAACDLPPAARAALLDRECGPDAALRREVDALLADADRAAAAGFLDAAPDAAPQLAARTVLGEYEVGRLLGEGGSGRVYEARHTRLGRRVALKVLSAAAAGDPAAVARFAREVAAVGRLDHPNVVAASDARQVGPHVFLVTELLDGVTLRDVLRARGPLPIAAAAEVARQVAAGVGCLAAHGLVHRDLGPANVMLTPAGRVAVLDLGLAMLAAGGDDHRLTHTGLFVGTVGYVAPEQVDDPRAVDARADLYSVGCLLYAMLAGRPPFRETADVPLRVWLERLASAPPPDVRAVRGDVPAALAELVTRLLATRPADRPASPEEVVAALASHAAGHDLGALVRGVMDATPAPGRLATPAVPRPRRRRRWGGAVALAGAVAVAAGVYLTRPKPSPDAPPFWEPTLLTSSLGREVSPAFSPDGRSVAYVWAGPTDDNADIYVKADADPAPRRLTTHPAVDAAPAWSPDGGRIAFCRHVAGTGVVTIVPSGGGAEEEVFTLDEPVRHLDWAPDGRHLVFTLSRSARPPGVYVLDLTTRTPRRVVETPPGAADEFARASPDGAAVAFVRKLGVYSEDQLLCTAPLAVGHEPQVVLRRAGFFRGVDWTPTGTELVFSFDRSSRHRLWRVPAAGGEPTELRFPLDDRLSLPVLARGAKRLAFVATADEWTVWRRRADGTGEAENLFATRRSDDAPAYSPDGKRIVFASDRSGENEIWVYDTAARTTKQITTFRGPDVGSPQWHPDGRRVVFDSTRDGRCRLYVADAADPAAGAIEVRVEGVDTACLPAWSADGRRVLFSARGADGDYVGWVPAAGGPPTRLAAGAGPRASADGAWVYFVDPAGVLCRVPATGGAAAAPAGITPRSTMRWALGRDGVYELDARDRARGAVTYRPFGAAAAARRLTAFRVERPYLLYGRYPGGRIAVSPDEAEVLTVEYTRDGSSVYVVNDFR